MFLFSYPNPQITQLSNTPIIMCPRTEMQFEEIRKEKRQLIMQTALKLFAEHGYENTTISQISKKAKISKGLLYNYFKSKEELLEAILNKGFDDMISFFDPNKDGILEVYEMKYFINESFRLIEENFTFWKLYWSISLQPTVFKKLDKRINEIIQPMMTMMNNYFKDRGSKNPTVDAILFGALMDGITLDYLMKPELFPLDMIKNEIITRFCEP